MGDVRLHTITIENDNLILQNGTVIISDTTFSTNSSIASLLTFGGISIHCSANATNSTSGGSLTSLGGAAFRGNSFFGDNVILDNINSTFQVDGLLDPRLSVTLSDFKIAPDGITTMFFADSESITQGNTIFSNEIIINSTRNAFNFNVTSGTSIVSKGGIIIDKNAYINGSFNFRDAIGDMLTTGSVITNALVFNSTDSVITTTMGNLILNSDTAFIITNTSSGNELVSFNSNDINFSQLVIVDNLDINSQLTINTTSSNSVYSLGGITIQGESFFNDSINIGDYVIFPNGLINSTTSGNLYYTSELNHTFYNGTTGLLTINSSGSLTLVSHIIDSGNSLKISSSILAQNSILELFTADGDTLDSNYINMYAKGTSTSITDAEYLQIGYNASNGNYGIISKEIGGNILRNLDIISPEITLSGSTTIQELSVLNTCIIQCPTTIQSNNLLIGSDLNANTVIDNVSKRIIVSMPSYTGSNIHLISGTSDSVGNVLNIGTIGTSMFIYSNSVSIPSTSDTSLSISGGMYIVKDLIVDGNINSSSTSTGNAIISSASIGSINATSISANNTYTLNASVGTLVSLQLSGTRGNFIECSIGSLNTDDLFNVNLTCSNIHVTTSSTFGGAIHVDNSIFTNKAVYNSLGSNGSFIESNNTSGIKMWSIDDNISTHDLTVSRYNSSGTLIDSPLKLNYNNGNTILSNATLGNIFTESINVNQDSMFIGKVTINDTTSSINTSNGSLIIKGSIAAQGNMNIGGDTRIFGDLFVNGITTSVNSTVVSIADNTFILNAGPVTSKVNAGILIQRYQNDNDTGLGDVISDSEFTTDILPDQSGLNANEIKTSTSASAVDDFYAGWYIKITSGFSNNQVRRVTSYNGTTRVATISLNWTSQNPSINDTIELYNKPFVGLVYNESSDTFEMISATNEGDTPIVTGLMSLKLRNFELENTFIISSTQNATSVTTGSLSTLGGIGVGQDIYVGGSITNASDERLKENIRELDYGVLDKINSIRAVSYSLKNDTDSISQYGFIAQDFLDNFDLLVRGKQGEYYSLDYQKVSVILLQCIKELRDKVELLEREYKN